jgi:hypothetical protein
LEPSFWRLVYAVKHLTQVGEISASLIFPVAYESETYK